MSVTKHNTLQIVLKRTHFMAVTDGMLCLRIGAVHRSKPYFSRHI